MTVVGLLLAVGAPALPGARCRGRSHLFDEAEPGEPTALAEQRHAQALGLCRHCPSLDACAAWVNGLKPSHRPGGVVAGRCAVTRRAPGRPPTVHTEPPGGR